MLNSWCVWVWKSPSWT